MAHAAMTEGQAVSPGSVSLTMTTKRLRHRVVLVQGRQLDGLPEAPELRERGGAGGRALIAALRELALAVGPRDQHGAAADQLRDEAQREPRGLIGEVQVVEHDHEARALGGALTERGFKRQRSGPQRRWHWDGLALLAPVEVNP